jgi:hypothetical protein
MLLFCDDVLCSWLLQIITPPPGLEHLLVGAELVLHDTDMDTDTDLPSPALHLTDLFLHPLAQHSVDMTQRLRAAPRAAARRITDVILYNGDLVALPRIKYLFDVVDEFIVVESWFTFSGHLKSHLFFRDPEIYAQFLPYMHKIKYLVIKYFPSTPLDYAGPQFNFAEGTKDDWWRETYARSFFKFFIRPHSSAADDDHETATGSQSAMYLVCDCDEIPDRELLRRFKIFGVDSAEVNLDSPLHFNMHFFYYNLQYFMKTPWAAPYMISTKGLFQLPDISYPRYTGGPFVGHGWHLSYFMSIDTMIRKIESFPHQELNTDANKNREHIKNCLRHGLDIYNRPPDEFPGFTRLTDEYIEENVPAELYAFHLEVLALQND